MFGELTLKEGDRIKISTVNFGEKFELKGIIKYIHELTERHDIEINIERTNERESLKSMTLHVLKNRET